MASSGVIESFPGPVPAGGRIEAIDTLRGFALLGIFVMNITGMAFPLAAYFNPMVYGGATGLDFGAWVFAHLFFELKMMGIFSMLFGALLSAGGGFAQSKLSHVVLEIEAKVAAGEEMTPRRQGLIDQCEEVRHSFDPTPEEIKVAALLQELGDRRFRIGGSGCCRWHLAVEPP